MQEIQTKRFAKVLKAIIQVNGKKAEHTLLKVLGKSADFFFP